MKQIQDGELSALLDGELDSQRAEDVRALIDADPALRQEFDAIAQLNFRVRRVAETAAFMPDVLFPTAPAPEPPSWHWSASIAAVLVVIIVARVLPKIAELPLLGVGLHISACVAISVFVVRMVRESEVRAAPNLAKGIRT